MMRKAIAMLLTISLLLVFSFMSSGCVCMQVKRAESAAKRAEAAAKKAEAAARGSKKAFELQQRK